jgi:hypothetical protein
LAQGVLELVNCLLGFGLFIRLMRVRKIEVGWADIPALKPLYYFSKCPRPVTWKGDADCYFFDYIWHDVLRSKNNKSTKKRRAG